MGCEFVSIRVFPFPVPKETDAMVNKENLKHIRYYLITSWILLFIGLMLASLSDDNWSIIIIGIFGSVAVFYRSLVPIPNKTQLGEYLNENPIIKWFTVMYSLVMAGSALVFMESFSGLLENTNIGFLMLILFLPFFVIWVKQEYHLYLNGEYKA